MKKDVGQQVALIMNRVLPLLACCMNLILSAPSVVEAQSSPTELSLFSLYQRPVEWPKFDELLLSSRATSWGEFSKLNQLDGFRWLAESDTARAYRSFARAVIADGGVPSDNDRIAPERREVYEQFRASVPRAIEIDVPRIARKYFVDPIRLRVHTPPISGGNAVSVRLQICRGASWPDPQGVQLDHSPMMSLVNCGGRRVSKAMQRVGGSLNVYETTLQGYELAGASEQSGFGSGEERGRGNFAMVSVGHGIGHVQSVWNLDVMVESPLGLVRPPLAGAPLRLREEMVTVRGLKAHSGRAVGWGLVTALGVVGMLVAPTEVWTEETEWCDSSPAADKACVQAFGGALLTVIGGIALWMGTLWESETRDSEAVRYNVEMRRATAEASRMWAEMQQRTMITVTPGARLPAIPEGSRDPSGGN
jgi:hypothetical protein